MRLFLLTTLTMVAFAANSVLNRVALADGDMEATLFGVIRLVSGALMLGLLLFLRGKGIALKLCQTVFPVLALLAYIFGFSAAYGALDPGFGALVLFSIVQVTMFAGALLAQEHVPAGRWAGAVLALAGLAWLLWPNGEIAFSLPHVAVMAVAGIGWGIYSLLGRTAKDPLGGTAINFILAALVGLVWLGISGAPDAVTTQAVALAMVSGALTSGLGYALWYQLLPALGAARAAVAQLSVPVIALAGGALFAGEALTMRFLLASALVMAGVLVSLRRG